MICETLPGNRICLRLYKIVVDQSCDLQRTAEYHHQHITPSGKHIYQLFFFFSSQFKIATKANPWSKEGICSFNCINDVGGMSIMIA